MNKEKIKINIYYNLSQELENLWLNFEKDSNLYLFQKYKFIKNFVKDKEENKLFIILSLKNKILAILPFEIKKKFGFKIIQWLGTKEFDYCGPVIANLEQEGIDDIQFKKAWEKIFTKYIKVDLIFLDKQLEKINDYKNPFVKYLENIIISKIYTIKLPENYQLFLEKIENKKFLNEFKRTTSKLTKDNKVEFFEIENNDKSIGVNEIIKQKAQILEKKEIRHILNNKMINFLNKLKDENDSLIKISALKINGEVIAANLGFVFNQRFYYFMPVLFSKKFNKFSPGKVLISYLIERSIINKFKVFDFGLGDENYKKYWSNSTETLFRYFKIKSLKGFIIYSLIKLYLFLKK